MSHPIFRDAAGVLCVGIGGGGDVVGALATADYAQASGLRARLGGVTWERGVIDPLPGPRRLDELAGLGERFDPYGAYALPETTGPGGFAFAESNMARVLDEPVVLIDPNGGPQAAGRALDAAAADTGCDLVALVDVGGDVLAHGDEPGLASPLCDAVLLAAARHAATPVIAGIIGPGCDGELTPDEVLSRLAVVAGDGGLLGAWGLTPTAAARLEDATRTVPTEASAQAVACARGAMGETTIRGGRRTVQLSPVGAITFFYDPETALAGAARLARAVLEAGSLDEAQAALERLGVRTELEVERERAARA